MELNYIYVRINRPKQIMNDVAHLVGEGLQFCASMCQRLRDVRVIFILCLKNGASSIIFNLYLPEDCRI
jgi:hypothetical protein